MTLSLANTGRGGLRPTVAESVLVAGTLSTIDSVTYTGSIDTAARFIDAEEVESRISSVTYNDDESYWELRFSPVTTDLAHREIVIRYGTAGVLRADLSASSVDSGGVLQLIHTGSTYPAEGESYSVALVRREDQVGISTAAATTIAERAAGDAVDAARIEADGAVLIDLSQADRSNKQGSFVGADSNVLDGSASTYQEMTALNFLGASASAVLEYDNLPVEIRNGRIDVLLKLQSATPGVVSIAVLDAFHVAEGSATGVRVARAEETLIKDRPVRMSVDIEGLDGTPVNRVVLTLNVDDPAANGLSATVGIYEITVREDLADYIARVAPTPAASPTAASAYLERASLASLTGWLEISGTTAEIRPWTLHAEDTANNVPAPVATSADADEIEADATNSRIEVKVGGRLLGLRFSATGRNGAWNKAASILLQKSTDDGSTWTTIQTLYGERWQFLGSGIASPLYIVTPDEYAAGDHFRLARLDDSNADDFTEIEGARWEMFYLLAGSADGSGTGGAEGPNGQGPRAASALVWQAVASGASAPAVPASPTYDGEDWGGLGHWSLTTPAATSTNDVYAVSLTGEYSDSSETWSVTAGAALQVYDGETFQALTVDWSADGVTGGATQSAARYWRVFVPNSSGGGTWGPWIGIAGRVPIGAPVLFSTVLPNQATPDPGVTINCPTFHRNDYPFLMFEVERLNPNDYTRTYERHTFVVPAANLYALIRGDSAANSINSTGDSTIQIYRRGLGEAAEQTLRMIGESRLSEPDWLDEVYEMNLVRPPSPNDTDGHLIGGALVYAKNAGVNPAPTRLTMRGLR